jgi:lysophospholipase L1-like esterase
MTTRTMFVAAVLVAALSVQTWAAEGANVLQNADFKSTGGWGGLGSDEKKEVAMVDAAGGKAVVLRRKQADAGVAIDQTVKLKPQTLYKLSATGGGTAGACLRLRPYASSDKDFGALSKPWAIGTAPFESGDKPQTMEFVFDTGLKVDSGIVMVYLGEPKQLGEFTLQSISLTELGSSKPAKDEVIVLHLGDSITITSYLPFHRRVDRLLDAMTKKEFPAVRTRHINWGADGEYVKDLLDSGRYKKTVKESFERIDVAIISYGPNDSRFYAADVYRGLLDRLCETLKTDYPGITIILATETDLFPVNEDVRKQYGAYWQASRDLAKEKGYRLVDNVARFAKEQSADLCRGPGDMHPSARGVEVMADETFKTLREVFAARAPAAAAPVVPASPAAETVETPEQALDAMKKELGDAFHYRVERVFAVASDAPEKALENYCTQTVAACFDAYMKQFFKTKPAGAFRVYLFKDDASYRSKAKTLFGTVPDTPYGYYLDARRALVMNIATGGGTLVHEMFHALVRADFPDIPTWANEGIASLFEQCGFDAGGLVGYVNWRLPILQDAIKKDTLPALRKIMTMPAAEFYADRQGKYAAARYLMLYLQERGLLVKFYQGFRDRFAQDKTGVKFVEELLGEKLEDFEPKWRQWALALKRT